MFYFAFRGDALLEQLLPGLMRRFIFQIGSAILSVLLVCLVIPRGAAAQDVQPDDATSQALRCDCAGRFRTRAENQHGRSARACPCANRT